VRESRTPGSVRGVLSNGHPYRVNTLTAVVRVFNVGRQLPPKPHVDSRRYQMAATSPKADVAARWGRGASDCFYEDWFVKTLTQLGRRALVSLQQQPP